MNVKYARAEALNLLKKQNGNYNRVALEVDMLLAHVLNIDRVGLITKDEYVLESEELKRFWEFCERRVNFEPMAYLVQKKEFYGLEFYVDENVLIPRPETETLIELILPHIKNNYNIVDIGTGSGAIALTIAKLCNNIEVTAIDISENALCVAKKNAVNILGENNDVHFICADALNYIPNKKFNILVSNPPYISFNDKNNLDKDLSYEPSVALFAEDNGLHFYKSLLKNIDMYLYSGGKFFFEIGYNQGESLLEVCREYKLENVFIEKDLSLHDRFLICDNYVGT